METNKKAIITIDPNITSNFFNTNFNTYLKDIKIDAVKENQANISTIVKVDENCANPFKSVHGGATAILIENICDVFLYYMNKTRFKTMDLNINYISPLELKENFEINIAFNRYKKPTCFVHVDILQKGEVCVSANLIKIKIEPKF
jgi:acyl-coenzyme A thioesterase PaaI-like protein